MLIIIRKILTIIILFFLSTDLSAQVEFLQKTFNLGILENWNETPAEFVFVNRGSTPVAVVNIRADDDLHVKYPNGYISPNQKAIIQVYYEPRNTGYFSKKVMVFTSSSDKPTELTVRGRVEAILECPAPGAPVYFYSSNSILLNAIVIDSKSNIPVSRAVVRFITPYNKTYTEKSQKDGRFQKRLETGTYAIEVETEGYKPFRQIFRVNKSNNFLCIDLVPVEKEDSLSKTGSQVTEKENTYTLEYDHPEDTMKSNKQEVVPDDNDLKPLSLNEYRPNNLVIMIDISENIENQDKLNTLKSMLSGLVNLLRSTDYISFIVFSDTFSQLMYPITCDNRNEINGAIENLYLSGTSSGLPGLKSSFNMILRNFIPDGNNQIIILLDKFKPPHVQYQVELYRLAGEIANNGIAISLGDFGNNQSQSILKQFINAGKVSYFPVSSDKDGLVSLVREIKIRSRK